MQFTKSIRLRPRYEYILLLIAAMPFVDTLNGIFNAAFPIGQLYRMALFFVLLLEYAAFGREKISCFLVVLASFCVIQVLVGVSYYKRNVIDTFKLFLPILMLLVFKEEIKWQRVVQEDIFHLLDFWSWIYPLLIIIPNLLGIGSAAYDGDTGAKGFFYAVNEISFIESSLVMYSVYRMEQKICLRRILLLFANCLCILLMGTKTGYATVLVFMAAYFWVSLRKKKMNVFIKNFFFLLLIIIGALAGIWIFQEQISSIFGRWAFQKEFVSTSTLDFLLSNRLRRWDNAVRSFINGGYIFFGWGLGGELAGFENMEMDWLDLLFRTGLSGFFMTAGFYFSYFRNYTCKKILPILIVLWAMLLSLGAGHVLFYGQSGMMLAMMFVVVMNFCRNIVD